MKREEKNAASRQKILDSARKGFAEKGYAQGSVNTICGDGELSKGILYHYFKDRDALYLACVEQCFQTLTAYLSEHGTCAGGGVERRLDVYFSASLRFFRAHRATACFCRSSVRGCSMCRSSSRCRPCSASPASIFRSPRRMC